MEEPPFSRYKSFPPASRCLRLLQLQVGRIYVYNMTLLISRIIFNTAGRSDIFDIIRRWETRAIDPKLFSSDLSLLPCQLLMSCLLMVRSAFITGTHLTDIPMCYRGKSPVVDILSVFGTFVRMLSDIIYIYTVTLYMP